VSEVFHPGTPGAQLQIEGGGRISGPAPEHANRARPHTHWLFRISLIWRVGT
jgi:hypothetical protein